MIQYLIDNRGVTLIALGVLVFIVYATIRIWFLNGTIIPIDLNKREQEAREKAHQRYS